MGMRYNSRELRPPPLAKGMLGHRKGGVHISWIQPYGYNIRITGTPTVFNRFVGISVTSLDLLGYNRVLQWKTYYKKESLATMIFKKQKQKNKNKRRSIKTQNSISYNKVEDWCSSNPTFPSSPTGKKLSLLHHRYEVCVLIDSPVPIPAALF